MKASELIVKLQEQIAQYGDHDAYLHVQTGPDSFEYKPVTGVDAHRIPRRFQRSSVGLVVEA